MTLVEEVEVGLCYFPGGAEPSPGAGKPGAPKAKY